MRLDTERLTLREFLPGDLGPVHVYGSDPAVTRYTSFGPNSLADTEDFLQRAAGAALGDPRHTYDLAIERKADSLLVGSVGLRLAAGGLIGGCGSVTALRGELGYVLRQDAWGHGYAAEAGRALTDFGFRVLGLHRVFAECHADNHASARVMEKIGMQREGVLRQHAFVKGEWWDLVVCGVLRGEWNCPY